MGRGEQELRKLNSRAKGRIRGQGRGEWELKQLGAWGVVGAVELIGEV